LRVRSGGQRIEVINKIFSADEEGVGEAENVFILFPGLRAILFAR